MNDDRDPGRASGDVANILLVDDNSSNLVAVEAALSTLGQNVVKAGSGGEALRWLLLQDFAVIILDVKMPDLDGFETARLIRGRARSRYTPIIFVTAYDDVESEILRGYSLGAVDFLFKPVVPEILRSKVAVFVDLDLHATLVRRQSELLREAERREHRRKLIEAKRQWEAQALRREMANERAAAEASSRRAEELAQSVAAREQAQRALKKTNDRLMFLAETARRILRTDRPREILPEICADLCRQLDFDIYLDFVAGEPGGAARLVSAFGVSEDERALLEVPAVAGEVSATRGERRAPVVREDVQRSRRPQDRSLRELGISAYAAYPLVSQGRPRAVLVFATRRRERLGREELTILRLTLDQVGMALDRARLIAELRHRADELVEADRRKDEFLAVLAHELRNPVASIHTALEVLRVPDADLDVQRDGTDVMRRQTRHLIRLIDDLLDVARINSGKIHLQKEPVEAAMAVEHAVETARPLLEARKQELEVVLPERPVEVLADLTRLTQVLTNLLNNAAKYTPDKGKIRVSVETERGGVTFRVRDNGSGIPGSILPRIFDWFTQGGNGQSGLGLGLALVKRLVEMHGGTVAVSSDQRSGSEFTVRLPEHRGLRRRGEDTASRPARAQSASRLVVLVDDDRDVREMTRRLLELWGHRVEMAQDGPEGVELILRLEPQVALVDIGLPGMDGYAVASKVRTSASEGRRPRLIAMTGYGQEQDRRRALASGFDYHLVKPADPGELQRLVDGENGESNGQSE